MKQLLCLLFFCSACVAQTGGLTFVIHDPTGVKADTALSSAYAFGQTQVGLANSIVLRISNPTANAITVNTVFVSTSSTSSSLNSNFAITGLYIDKTLAVNSGNFEDITLSYSPLTLGIATGYLQVSYTVQSNGCNPTSSSSATACSSYLATVSTLTGTGIASQLTVSYQTASGNVQLQSGSATPLNFGNVSVSGTSVITFVLTNNSSSSMTTPAVSLTNQLYASSAFNLNTAALTPTISGSASETFTVTFAPGQTGLTSATLNVGTGTYAIQGTGIVLASIDALQISYVDSSGVRGLPQAATPINFGQLTAGTGANATLTFTVTNPTTSYNAVSVSNLTVSGTGYTITGAPSIPATIQPGASISFKLVFSGGPTGTYTGSLAIGSRVFALTAQSVSLNLPTITFSLDQSTLKNQQQVHLTIQLASASQIAAIGNLAMSFTPSVTDVSDDAAVEFLTNSGRQLQVNVASGGQTATYNNASAIGFQTGTTAGTITFTLTFPYLAPVTQSFTISPQPVQITSGSAIRQSPNLVVTLNGYDNTYSVGQISFTFYDTSGKVINSNPLTLDETSAFHQYFFTNNQAGGAFALQATFPVTGGDVSQVGSVAVTFNNSAGSASTTQTFQ